MDKYSAQEFLKHKIKGYCSICSKSCDYHEKITNLQVVQGHYFPCGFGVVCDVREEIQNRKNEWRYH